MAVTLFNTPTEMPQEECGSIYCGCQMSEHTVREISPYVAIFTCSNGCCPPRDAPGHHVLVNERYVCASAVNHALIARN
jgi:hypothetical protein